MSFRAPVAFAAAVLAVGLATTTLSAQVAIGAGQTVGGRLENGDARAEDDTFYDLYEYRGQAGETITIVMRSSEFDAFLQGGVTRNGSFELLDFDDDGAGGTDAQLVVTLDGSGVYHIRANALSAGGSGGYTLSVQSSAAAAPGGGTVIASGQTVSGRLDSSDSQLADDSYYDLYEYRGQPGESVTVTMRSGDFDAYLQGGPADGTDVDAVDSDDDSAGGTDARMSGTVPASGVYRIRANSLGSGRTGSYTLTVEGQSGTATGGPSAGTALSAGRTVSGRLESSDNRMSDDSYYDLYEYRGQPGENIVVTMRSPDFDAYLQGGPADGGDVAVEDSNDDGAGGTDAQLSVTVGATGIYRIRANSLGAGQTGSYTIDLQSDRSGAASSSVLAAGQTVAGRLDGSDPQLADDSYFDGYFYDGTAGEELLITLSSNDFDTYLRWGRGDGSSFESIVDDDDGAGNTNSRIEVTVDQTGRYMIMANSYSGGMTGAYTLSIESLSGTPAFPTISLGQTVSSQLDTNDAVRSDDTYYELYVYRGQPGQQVLVTMRSSAFDTYLQAGRLVGDNFEADASDDDSGGGTDSQVLVAVPQNGNLAILTNSWSAGGLGAYSLTVEGLEGGGAPTPTTSTTLPTIGAGNTVSGTLAPGDGLLADSSYYDQYVYSGSPGDRIRITLRSSDFDAYLGWGRTDGSGFTGEVYDDDSGGGRDSQLDVTVDGTGLFGIMANTYTAGQSGAYTLSVERLGSGPAPTPTTSANSGAKWLYRYADATVPSHRSLSQRVKQAGTLEEIVSALQRRYDLTRPVEIRFDTCEMINAFYMPSRSEIVFCYELLEFLANVFVADGQWTEDQRSNVFGAVQFIMMHEVGHALVDVLDLPITGREEDVADQLAVYALIRNSEKGAQAAVAGVQALQPSSTQFDDTQLADEHSLGPVRLYNVLCWIYGSDPGKYGQLVSSGALPEARARRCPGEWDQMAKAWQRLLADFRPFR